MILHDEARDLELCCVVYICPTMADDSSVLVLFRCLTPSPCVPVNKAICLSHLASVLQDYGLLSFYANLKEWIFNRHEDIGDLHRRLAKGWNRIVLKEFRTLFPQLLLLYCVTEEDQWLVSEYLDSQSKVKAVPKSHVFTNVRYASNIDCSEQLFLGKRQRVDYNVFVTTNPTNNNGSIDSNNGLGMYEECGDFNLDNRKRRR